MAKHSKRYNGLRKTYDRDQIFEPAAAVSAVKASATAKFDETIEMHLRTGVDPRHAEQQVRGVITLPHGTGREVKIVVFAGPDGQGPATEAGADFVGGDDLAKQIQDGWTDFDLVLTTPDMMRVVGRLGRVLGPRGLMPSPKTGTIVQPGDIGRVIQESRLGRVEYRVDKTSNIHVPIGKASFEESALFNNMAALMEAIMSAKPSSMKAIYVQRVTLCSTMGPGIKVDTLLAGEMHPNGA